MAQERNDILYEKAHQTELRQAQRQIQAIPAHVVVVSQDAVGDEEKGLLYSARVLLERSTMKVGEKLMNLTPAMAVSVEVKTGKRRLIEYFLSPLIQHGSEALRER